MPVSRWCCQFPAPSRECVAAGCQHPPGPVLATELKHEGNDVKRAEDTAPAGENEWEVLRFLCRGAYTRVFFTLFLCL